MESPVFRLPAAHGPSGLVAAGARPVSAGRLLAQSRAIAELLPPASPGSEILVICGDRHAFAACLLAAWRAGHAVALPPGGRPEAVRELAAMPHVRAMLHDSDNEDRVDVRPVLDRPLADDEEPVEIEADRHLATLYTSGTTGVHRPCRKTAGQLLGEAASLARTFSIGAGDTVLATVPAHHIYGLLFGTLMPLSCGAAYLRGSPLHAEAVAAAAAEGRASVLASVPAHLRGLSVLPDDGLKGLRRIFSSGAPLDPALAVSLRRFGADPIDVLGSSETGGFAWRHPAAEGLWQTMPGMTVSAGQEGQLLLDSPFTPPDAPRPMPCADRLSVEGEGRFRHLGRLDDVVKVGGRRVALSEIEQRLRAMAGVRDAGVAAVGAEGARGTEILAAVEADALDAAAVRRELLRWFEPAQVPRAIRVVARLPRGGSGKMSRADLLSLFDGSPAVQGRRDFDIRGIRRELAPDGAELRTLVVRVPEDLLYFKGHFPEVPILAAVAQLQKLVLEQAKAAWPDLGALRRLTRLKFRRPIAPGEVLVLELKRAPGSLDVAFELTHEGQPCSHGTLGFDAAGAAR